MKYIRINALTEAPSGRIFASFALREGMLWWKQERNVILYKEPPPEPRPMLYAHPWYVLSTGERVEETSAYSCHGEWKANERLRKAHAELVKIGGLSIVVQEAYD